MTRQAQARPAADFEFHALPKTAGRMAVACLHHESASTHEGDTANFSAQDFSCASRDEVQKSFEAQFAQISHVVGDAREQFQPLEFGGVARKQVSIVDCDGGLIGQDAEQPAIFGAERTSWVIVNEEYAHRSGFDLQASLQNGCER
jgi:hypothetical protein